MGWSMLALYQTEPLLTGRLWKPCMEVIGGSVHVYEKTLNTCKGSASFLIPSSLSCGRNLIHLLFSSISLSCCVKKSYFLITVPIIFQVNISFHSLQTIFFPDMLNKQGSEWVSVSVAREDEWVSRRKSCSLGNLWVRRVWGDIRK